MAESGSRQGTNTVLRALPNSDWPSSSSAGGQRQSASLPYHAPGTVAEWRRLCCAVVPCARQIVATGLGLQHLATNNSTASGRPQLQTQQEAQRHQQQQLLVVSFVVEGSPAAQAGVQEGDAVLSVGGRDVQDKELRWAGGADVVLSCQHATGCHRHAVLEHVANGRLNADGPSSVIHKQLQAGRQAQTAWRQATAGC